MKKQGQKHHPRDHHEAQLNAGLFGPVTPSIEFEVAIERPQESRRRLPIATVQTMFKVASSRRHSYGVPIMFCSTRGHPTVDITAER